jgi:DedD protein
MGLFSRNTAAAAPPSGDAVEQARTRARRRLIGAVVLVGAGIVAFPLLFETAPRPIPVDVPIEIPRKDAVAPLQVPPSTQANARAASGVVQAPREPVRTAETPPPPTSAPAPVAAAPAPKAERPASPPDKPAPAADKPLPAADPAGRIVVQVGAYADANVARNVRQRVEKLGLKAFTQPVETDAGKRIRVRVGPFATREQAEQASAKLKSAGLPAAVLGT